jgi:predicted secreted protein
MNDDLKLSALSRITLFDGTVIVSRDGTITLQGELIAQKGVRTTKLSVQNEDGTTTASIDASGSATFADISVEKHTAGAFIASSAEEQKNVLPNVKAGTAAAGSAIMTAGETQLVIYSDKLAGSSLVYLSPTSSTKNQTLYVSEKKVCTPTEPDCKPYFIVTLDNPIDTDVDFNWWIIR